MSYMHPEIQIGPIFASDLPGCHECLEDRLIAGDPKPEYTKAFWETYDQDPKAGTRGFLEHHALIAAGLARSLAEEAPGATRSLYTYHVLTGEIIHHTFVPVSTCPRWRESGLNETTARKGEVL
ncbi:TOMM precursor leader peptide-binding protein (plasmid) [Streptomyces sp. NBC_00715]|uniref:TOMM precursor leader peptide-binding protein n=1 Tax=Streptomyces sp. NBC_00715 TaxID=2975811 RepID=UPI003870C3DB